MESIILLLYSHFSGTPRNVNIISLNINNDIGANRGDLGAKLPPPVKKYFKSPLIIFLIVFILIEYLYLISNYSL